MHFIKMTSEASKKLCLLCNYKLSLLTNSLSTTLPQIVHWMQINIVRHFKCNNNAKKHHKAHMPLSLLQLQCQFHLFQSKMLLHVWLDTSLDDILLITIQLAVIC